MPLSTSIEAIAETIGKRIATTRQRFLEKFWKSAEVEPARSHLCCGNQAHAYAAMDSDKATLIADGRMTGASGRVSAAILVVPEAADSGMVAKLRDGDNVRVDANSKELRILADSADARIPARKTDEADRLDNGREKFKVLRRNAGAATDGASVVA